MKAYEHETVIDTANAFLVRLDGKTFSSFTTKFRKPFDVRFTRAMTKTAVSLLQFFGSSAAFVCSDEITLVHPPIYGSMLNHPHSGRKNKIATLAAGKCSTLFLLAIMDEVRDDPELLQHVLRQAPCFDARVMEVPLPASAVDVAKNVYWRSVSDCRKNTVSSYARFLLGTKGSLNMHSGQMIEAMRDPALVVALKNALHKKARPGAEPTCLADLLDEDETQCLTCDGAAFDFERMPLHRVFGTFVKKVEIDLQTAEGEPFVRARPQLFEMKMEPRTFDAAAEWLLAPKLTAAQVGEAVTQLGAHRFVMQSVDTTSPVPDS